MTKLDITIPIGIGFEEVKQFCERFSVDGIIMEPKFILDTLTEEYNEWIEEELKHGKSKRIS